MNPPATTSLHATFADFELDAGAEAAAAPGNAAAHAPDARPARARLQPRRDRPAVRRLARTRPARSCVPTERPMRDSVADARRRRASQQAEARIDELLAMWRSTVPRRAAWPPHSGCRPQPVAPRSRDSLAMSTRPPARRACWAGAAPRPTPTATSLSPSERSPQAWATSRAPGVRAARARPGAAEPADRAQPAGRLDARGSGRGSHAAGAHRRRAPPALDGERVLGRAAPGH